MRRVVRDYIAAALDRQGPGISHFIAENLIYPESFPLDLVHPSVAIHDISQIRLTPRIPADFPLVEVTVTIRVSITAESRRREGAARGVRTASVRDADLGLRTFAMDVELDALGTVASAGYRLTPRRARFRAWWGSL